MDPLPQQTFQQATPVQDSPAPAPPPAAPVNHGHRLLAALVNGAHQVGQAMYDVNNPDLTVQRSQQQQDQLKQIQLQHDEQLRQIAYGALGDPNTPPDARVAWGDVLHHHNNPNAKDGDLLGAVMGVLSKYPPVPFEQTDEGMKLALQGKNAVDAAHARNDKPDKLNLKPDVQSLTLPDGKTISAQYDGKQWTDLAGAPLSREALGGAVVTPKSAPGPKVGSLGEFLTEAYGPHPTAAQQIEGRTKWAQATAGTTTGTHTVMVPQPDGTIKAITVQTSSTKHVGGGGANPSGGGSPKAGGASAASEDGKTVGGRMTGPQAKAQTEYVEATKVASLADDAVSDPKNPEKQWLLVYNLLHGSLSRVNEVEIGRIQSRGGWSMAPERWEATAKTGGLAPELVSQLASFAHAQVKATKDAMDAIKPGKSSGSTGPSDDDIIKALSGQKK